MVERAIILVALAVVVLGGSLLARWVARRRTSGALGRRLPAELAGRLTSPGPSIVYFYGRHCADCRRQSIILDQLAQDQGIAVTRVDAARENAIAGALAVMTVPSTVVVDDARRVRAINLGLRPRDILLAQLHGAA